MITPPNVGFVNSLKATTDQGGSGSNLSNASNYVSITAMRSRLAVINASLYTSTELDRMTVNDMVYAIRMADDKTTISNYQP
jgi:hypothetical protein